MQRSGSQIALLVLSILAIIGAALSLFAAIFFFIGAGAIQSASPSDLAELTAETGLTGTEVASMTFGVAVSSIISSIAGLLMGIFGIRASNDASKVMPVWVFAIIDLVLCVISFIVAIASNSGPQGIGTAIGSLIAAGVIFWLANNIKRQAGR